MVSCLAMSGNQVAAGKGKFVEVCRNSIGRQAPPRDPWLSVMFSNFLIVGNRNRGGQADQVPAMTIKVIMASVAIINIPFTFRSCLVMASLRLQAAQKQNCCDC